MIARLLSRLAAAAARRPRLVLAGAAVLAVAAVALALRLPASAATDTFVSSSSAQYKATERYYRNFGEEPVVVLVKGNLQELLLSSDIERLLGLEECLSGKLAGAALADAGGPHGPCAALARAGTVKVVLGPGTFLNEAARQIDQELARESARAQAQAAQSEAVVYRAAIARGYTPAGAHGLAAQAGKIITARFQESVVTLALQYGLTERPSITDPNFVSSVWCSTRASPSARPSSASRICSRARTRRSCRCGCTPG